MPDERRTQLPRGGGLARVVERNITALAARRAEDDKQRGLQDRIADAITRFTGSMRFVYLHVLLFGLWITINLGWIPGIPRFDPSFVILAMAASVEAIFLSTFVLITQNRMAQLADERADLDLQISLLAEHEVTRIITLVTRIAERLEVAEARDPELPELEQDIAPEAVLDEIEHSQQKLDRRIARGALRRDDTRPGRPGGSSQER